MWAELAAGAGFGGALGVAFGALVMKSKVKALVDICEGYETQRVTLTRQVERERESTRHWCSKYQAVVETNAGLRQTIANLQDQLSTATKNDARDPKTGRFVKQVSA